MRFVIGGGTGTDAMLFSWQSDAYETCGRDARDLHAASSNGHFQVIDLGAHEREFLVQPNTGKDLLGKSLVNPAKLKWFRNKSLPGVSCALDRRKWPRKFTRAGQPRLWPAFRRIIGNGTIRTSPLRVRSSKARSPREIGIETAITMASPRIPRGICSK